MKVVDASYKILTSFLVDPTLMIEKIGRVCYHSEDKIKPGSSDIFIQKLIERGHESVLEHSLVTVQFTVDRGISHELVRHRLASFTQESTRYCDYTNEDKYPDGVIFVRPSYLKKDSWMECIWQAGCADCERDYQLMINNGAKPEEARALLNNSVATTIVVSANFREWRHILDLRCAKGAHPQIRAVMLPLLKELHEEVPVVFDDIYEKYYGSEEKEDIL